MNNDLCKTILLVEDEAIIAITQKTALEKIGYKVVTANSGEKAIALTGNMHDIDLILMDIDLGKGPDGPETATMILKERDIPVVFLSSHTEPLIVEKTEKITSYGYVVKNSGITVLDASIKMAFKLFDAKEKVNSHSARNSAIIQAMPDHMFVLDRSGKYLEIYTSNDFQLPIPSSEIIGKKISDLFNEEVSMKLLNLFSSCFASGELQVCEIELLIKGRKNLYETRLSRMNGENILAFVRNITEEKNAIEALRVSEEKYRLIFENSPLGLLSFDEKGVIEACNDNFVKIIGSSMESLIGLNMLNLKDENLVEALKKALNGSMGIYEGIYRSVTADKSTPVRVLFTRMNTGDGAYRGGVGIIEDITDRKIAQDEIKVKNEELNAAIEDMQAANEELERANEELVQSQKELIEYGNALDESERKYRDIYNNAVEGIFQTTFDGKLIGSNPSYAATFGFESPESIMNEVNNIGYQLYADPNERERLLKLIIERNRVVNFETTGLTRKGEAIRVLINASALKDENGLIKTISGTMIDITEKKLAEDLLRESEMRFDQMAEQSRIIVWEVDENGLYTYISHVVEDVLGYKPEEITGIKYFYDLCPEDERESLKTGVFEAFERHEQFVGLVNSMESRSGRIIRVTSNAMPIIDEHGNLRGYRGSDRDITDYLLTLDSLKSSESRYRTLIENTGQAIVVVQDGMVRYANPAASSLTGYTQGELYSRPFTEFIHQDDRNLLMENYKKRLAGDSGIKSVYKFRSVSKEGNIRWIEINAVMIDWYGSPATLNFLTDFSEQLRIENELRESENKYRRIFENVQDIFYQTDKNGLIIEISPSVERYTGFTREELIGKPVEEVYSDPRDRVELLKTIAECGEVIDYELRLKGKDNGEVITSVSSHILYDSEGRPAGLEGSLRDITGRKQAEVALRKSEQLHRLLADNTTDVIWTMDMSGCFTYVSPSVEKMRGFTAAEVMQQSFKESLMPESAAIADSVFKSALASFQAGLPVPEFRGELEQPCKDGSTLWIEATISLMYNTSGEVIGIVGVSRDIRDRKLAETVLRESEERFRSMFENHSAVMLLIDPATGRIVDSNKSAGSFYGYNKSTLDSMNIDEINALSSGDVVEKYKSALDENQNFFEFPHKLSNGDIRTVEVHSSPVVINNEKLLFSIIRDITERKFVEKALRDSEELYRSVITASPDVLLMTDLEGIFLMITPLALVMFGYDREDEILGHMYTEFIIPEDRERAIKNTSLRFNGNMNGIGEYRGLRKDGSRFEMDVNGEFIRDPDGKPSKIVFIVRDITERRLAEDKIRSLLTEKEIILKEVHHRIKNYMNTIKGLLYLQSGTSDEPSVVEALEDAGSRVQSMMVLYDKLYQSADYTSISMAEYLPALVDDIIGNFPNSRLVRVFKKIDDFSLNTSRLQPLGIIINELLTNTMKYAFAGRESGVVTITASQTGKQIRIEIMDNGVGLPESVSFENAPGFGMQLVGMLVEQLHASILIDRIAGTKYTMEFKV